MLLSIIIPCFNCENTIINCLESISSNSNEIEIIAVNDCSTDNTLEILKKYSIGKDNFKIINNEINMGAGKSRNIGINECSGDYIVFLDSDDVFINDAINKIFNILTDNNLDILIFEAQYNKKNMSILFSGSRKSGVLNKKEALVYCKGCTCGKVYKSEIIKSNLVLFGNIKINEDMIFTKTAISFANNIYYLNQRLYRYIANSNSLMNIVSKNDIAMKYAEQGFYEMKNKISGFDRELNSIYLIEVVYSVSKNLFFAGEKYKKRKEIFKKLYMKYDKHDIYYKKYSFKYKIMIFLFKIIYGCYL